MTPDMMGRTGDNHLLGAAKLDALPEIDDDALDRAAKILGEAGIRLSMSAVAIDAGEPLRQLSEMLQARCHAERTRGLRSRPAHAVGSGWTPRSGTERTLSWRSGR